MVLHSNIRTLYEKSMHQPTSEATTSGFNAIRMQPTSDLQVETNIGQQPQTDPIVVVRNPITQREGGEAVEEDKNTGESQNNPFSSPFSSSGQVRLDFQQQSATTPAENIFPNPTTTTTITTDIILGEVTQPFQTTVLTPSIEGLMHMSPRPNPRQFPGGAFDNRNTDHERGFLTEEEQKTIRAAYPMPKGVISQLETKCIKKTHLNWSHYKI